MFQFDAGTFTDTLNKYGNDVLTIAGNTSHAINYVINMVKVSAYTTNAETDAKALQWINNFDFGNGTLRDQWIKTVTRYYNGCQPGWFCWSDRYNHYNNSLQTVVNETGLDFWIANTCKPEPEVCNGKDDDCDNEVDEDDVCEKEALLLGQSWVAPARTTDIDGDGLMDVCGRGMAGVWCHLSQATSWGENGPVLELSDKSGWDDPTNWGTMRWGDIDGDGRADLCARANANVDCWKSDGTKLATHVVGPGWSDDSGWNDFKYHSTIRLLDIDGDGKDDLCARAAKGVVCYRSTGNGFDTAVDGPAWSNEAGYGEPKFYGTLRTGDVNGDGREDLCIRSKDGMECWLSNGSGFPTRVQGPNWSDEWGWSAYRYWSTIRLVDVNGDRLIQYEEVSGYVGEDVFSMLDVNMNGVLDCEDLAALMPIGEGEITWEGELPWEGEPEVTPCPLPEVHLETALDIFMPYMDTDGDGNLSQDEIAAVEPGFDPSMLLLLDTNEDGLISREEILAMTHIMTIETSVALLPVEDDLIVNVDTNGDRLVQFSEVSILGETLFNYMDVNGNGVWDCEDLNILLTPQEGETPPDGDGCVETPVELIPFSGRFGYGLSGPFDFTGELTKDTLEDAAWRLTGTFNFPTSGYELLEPEIIIRESYPEQVSVIFRINAPAPDAPVLMIYTSVTVSAEIAVANGATFDITTVTCTPPLSGEGELSPEGELPPEGEGDDWGWIPYPGDDVLSEPMVRMVLCLFLDLDADGDDALSYEEITAYLPLPEGLYALLDADGDGVLTRDELYAARETALGAPAETLIQVIRTIIGAGEGNFYIPGMPFTVTLRIERQGTDPMNSLNLTEILPEGWAIGGITDKSGAGVSMKSDPEGQLLSFEWTNPEAFPITLSYTLTPPAEAKGIQTILGQAGYDMLGELISGEVIPTVVAELLDVVQTHTADTDHDWRISLRELLRVIQLYNSGGYQCAVDTEDGYAPGLAQVGACLLTHLADTSGDWIIDLPELLRVIQLYNSESGHYYVSDKTEDGFMVAPF